MAFRRERLCFRLRDRGDALLQRSRRDVVSGLLGVVILLCDQLFVVEGQSALVVELLLFEIGLGLFDISLGRQLGGNVGVNIGLRCGDGRVLGVNGRRPAARFLPLQPAGRHLTWSPSLT